MDGFESLPTNKNEILSAFDYPGPIIQHKVEWYVRIKKPYISKRESFHM